MARVQHNQSHTVQNTLLDPLNDFVADLSVGLVSPPGEHIGIVQHLFGETMLRLIKSGSAYGIASFAQKVGQHGMNAFGIMSGYLLIATLVTILVPDGNAKI